MRFREDINKIMDSVDINVDNEMKNKILNQTTKSSERKRSSVGTRKVVAVAMAAVLCIGTMVVGVGAVTGVWDDIVEKVANSQIEVNQQQKINLIENGYVDTADEDKVSDNSDGITVSLVQTIADKKGIYIFLKINSENMKLKKESFFNYVRVNVEGVGNVEGMIDDISLLSDYEGVMQIYGRINNSKYESLDVDGKDIEVVLGDLQYIDKKQGEVKYETLKNSEWKFSWIGKGCNDSRVIKLSNNIYTDDLEIKLHSLEITPLSVLIEFECIRSNSNDWINIPFTVVMKDGTKYKYEEDGFDTIFRADTQTTYGADYSNIYKVDKQPYDYTFIRIEKPIDINEIDYLEVGGKKYDAE